MNYEHCTHCGNSFDGLGVIGKHYEAFCSIKCARDYYGIHQGRCRKRCWNCKKIIDRIPIVDKYDIHYCSQECAEKYNGIKVIEPQSVTAHMDESYITRCQDLAIELLLDKYGIEADCGGNFVIGRSNIVSFFYIVSFSYNDDSCDSEKTLEFQFYIEHGEDHFCKCDVFVNDEPYGVTLGITCASTLIDVFERGFEKLKEMGLL